MSDQKEKMLDLIIIGASAAGCSAAIYAARAELNLKVISMDWGGEVSKSGEVLNYPGIISTTGIELAKKFKDHMDANGVDFESPVEVTNIEKQADNHFQVMAKKGSENIIFTSKSVIIATGVHPKSLHVPGEEEFKNKGVSYCTVCDGPLYRNKEVVIVGSGNSAMEAALMMVNISSKVTLVNKRDEFRGEAVYIKKILADSRINIIWNAQTIEILGDQNVSGIKYIDKDTNETKEVKAQGIFIHIGLKPNSDFINEVDKNHSGEILVDSIGQTNIEGLFAAGDITNVAYKQIVISAGMGSIAALSVINYLNKLEN
jgi:thioredoxin-disulfide reductase